MKSDDIPHLTNLFRYHDDLKKLISSVHLGKVELSINDSIVPNTTTFKDQLRNMALERLTEEFDAVVKQINDLGVAIS